MLAGLAGVTGKMEFDDLMEKVYSSSGSDTLSLWQSHTAPWRESV
jgi:hypothetical protein